MLCRLARIAIAPALALVAACAPARVPLRSPDAGLVRMHVESDAPRTVVMGADTCPAPCDRELDGRRGQQFFFAGDFPESEHFTLLDQRGPVTARVHHGSHLRQKGGYVMIGAGGFIVIDGVESIATGALIRTFGHEADTIDLGKGFQVGGIIAIAVGLATVGVGIALAQSGATTYELLPTPAKPSAPRLP